MSNSIPFSSIVEGERARSSNKYGDLDGLINSLKSLGSIHPIVLSKRADGKYDLIAGGRRYRAMKKMGVTELHHGCTLDAETARNENRPVRYGFLYQNEVPEHVLREAELDENLHRLDMDWIDNVLLIDKVHTLKKASAPKWGQRQTAELLGPGYSLTNISYSLNIAKKLRAGDPAYLACKHMREAIALWTKQQEDMALAEGQRRALLRVSASPLNAPGSTSSFLDTLGGTLSGGGSLTLPASSAGKSNQIDRALAALSGLAPVERKEDSAAPAPKAPPVRIPLSSMFRLGDSLREHMPSFPDACFDHIVTDIPYGIDMDNLTVKGKDDVAAQHEVEANVADMPVFLEQAFRLVKSGGFCVFFMDGEHFSDLLRTAKDIGWRTQDWMLIWYKTHTCRNGAPAYNFTKNYETAMVLRKDEKAVLRKHGPSAVWMGDGAAERKMYNNPFAKPFLLWKELIFDNIAFAGQSVYDPYGGELSSCKAAANCGLIPYASEISPIHYNRGLEHMKGVYSLIHQSNCEFV